MVIKMPVLRLVLDQSEVFPSSDLSQVFSLYTGSSLLSFGPLTFAKRVLMKPLSGVRVRAALSPLIGFPSSSTLIALPLLSPVTRGSYEDIHHSGLSGFKVFPREKGKINRDVKGY